MRKCTEEKRKELNNDKIAGLDSEMIYKDYYNLKERCEYLQRSCERKEEQRDTARMEYMEQEDYKSRIDKAVDYIKQESWFCYKDNEEVIDRTPVEKLLNILKGEDNNGR